MLQFMHSFIGQSAPPEILDRVRKGTLSSFCLFRYSNVASPSQVRALTTSLIAAAHEGGFPPPLIGIDQEGGQLVAVEGGTTELPGNMALGATRSPELARQAGHVLGRELLAMGVNLNFAPSLDVNINPANPVIGIRSFGDDPVLVAELGVALIDGIQSEGVIATAKHFPGHGDTAADSHHDVPVVHHSLKRVQEVELHPFQMAVRAGVRAVMSAHILYSELDATTPATLSEAILTGLLRREMSFQGLVLTDAMDMHAVAREGAVPSIEAALRAGADLILLGHLTDQLQIADQMASLQDAAAVERITAARRSVPTVLPSLDVIGCSEHRRIAQSIADQSITLVKDGGQLPLRLAEQQTIAVITPVPLDLTPADTSSAVQIQLADALRKRHGRVLGFEIPQNADNTEIRAILSAVEAARPDCLIVGTINAGENSPQAELVNALIDQGHQPLVAALRTPYDVLAFPRVETYLCAYSIRSTSMEALAKVVFGEIPAKGVLPCAIPGIAASGSVKV